MDNATDPSTLARIQLFRGLKDEELAQLSAQLHEKRLPAGALLLSSEQRGEAVYLILEGTVRVFLHQADGTEVILAIVGPGQTIGEMSPVDKLGRSADVQTMEPTRLVWMDATAFRGCLATMPALSLNLIHLLSERLRAANERIQALSSLRVAGRVARQLLAFASQYGEMDSDGATTIPLRLTQSDLAALVGSSRERANRAVVSLKEQGLISVGEGHRVSILDSQGLSRRCT